MSLILLLLIHVLIFLRVLLHYYIAITSIPYNSHSPSTSPWLGSRIRRTSLCQASTRDSAGHKCCRQGLADQPGSSPPHFQSLREITHTIAV